MSLRTALLLLKLAAFCVPPVFNIVREPSAAPAPKPAVTVPAPGNVPDPPPLKLAPARRLIFVTATWCQHCKPTERAINDWKRTAKPRQGERVEYEKVDADLYPGRVRQFNVTAYPTLIVTLSGREVARHEGRMVTAGGIERFVSQDTGPVRRVSLPTSRAALKPEFRDTERMRRHLIEDHGDEHSYTPQQIRAMSREQLFKVHDMVHGEVLR
jgi:thiol-disulfide isomerase/thioredoxin